MRQPQPSRPLRSRTARGAVALLALSTVVLAACSNSSTKSAISSATTAAGGTATSAGGPTIASKLVLGGAPECPQRPFCAPGLQRVYGITFSSFKPLDADGPLTYAALTSGQIDVGLVFTTDGLVAAKNLVVLDDDKHLQNADNIVPLLRSAKSTPKVAALLNNVSAALTTTGLIGLNKSISVDKADPSDVAASFLKDKKLDTASADAAGTTLTVGSFGFSESVVLADIYGKALQAAGAHVTFKTNLGTREVVEPALQKGDIDLLPEYAATALEFVNKGAGEASGDVTATVQKLTDRMTPLGVTVLTASPAIDTNAFAVTQATATKYHLTKLSDLANPAP